MDQTEIYTLHGIALRLFNPIPVHRAEALMLTQWIGTRPDIFGTLPLVAPAGRYKSGVTLQDWRALGDHIRAASRDMATPQDRPLDHMRIIATHLDLGPDEAAISRSSFCNSEVARSRISPRCRNARSAFRTKR